MSLLRFPVLVLLTVCSTDHTIPCKWEDVSDERFFVLWELSNIISKNLTVLLNQNIEYFFILVRHESMKSCQCSNMGVTVNITFLQLFLDLL